MNLGIVTPQLSGYGGAEIYLLECLKRWQQVLHVTIYTPDFNPALFTEFGVDPERVVVLPIASARDAGDRFRLLHETVILPRLWEQEIGHHDLYFLYQFPTQMIQRRPSVWFASEPLRMLYDLRHLTSARHEEITVHRYPRRDYDRLRVSDLDVVLQVIEQMDQTASFDRLATNSLATGRYLENVYGRSPDLVAYPGVDVSGPFEPPKAMNRILYLGRLWRHKRVELILRAMARLKPAYHLTVVGEGPEQPRLEEQVRRLGLEANVDFVGEVSVAERNRLYSACALCVYTPVREPFGMTPLEAAAAGRPVVATPGGGFEEVLPPEAVCRVPADEAALAGAIHRILSDPSRVVRMGQAARESVKDCSWDRTAEQLLELFCRSARRRRGVRVVSRGNGAGGSAPDAGPVQPRLGAHYFSWYRAGKHPVHWNENRAFSAVTDWPIGGPYSSGCESVINTHLDLAQAAGLDFFVVNWRVDFDGPDPIDVEATQKLFAAAEARARPFQLALLLEFDVEDSDVIQSVIEEVKRDYLTRAAYLRYAGQPVLWYGLNQTLLGHLFQHHGELEQLHGGVHVVAASKVAYHKFLPRLVREFFHGWCLYSPLEVGSMDDRDSVWRESYRDFEEDGGRVRVFTISPGYDDVHLEIPERCHNRFRLVPRQGLSTYEHMQDVALGLEPVPHFVIVSSFNEFHENTHIEPSVHHGDRYLRSTCDFKTRLHP